MADIATEVAKIEEVYSMGFITQEEYQSRLRALGVEPTPTPSGEHVQMNTDLAGTTTDSAYNNNPYESYPHSHHHEPSDEATFSSYKEPEFNTYNVPSYNNYGESELYNTHTEHYGNTYSANSFNAFEVPADNFTHSAMNGTEMSHENENQTLDTHYDQVGQITDYNQFHGQPNDTAHDVPRSQAYNQPNLYSHDQSHDKSPEKSYAHSHEIPQIQPVSQQPTTKIFRAAPPPPNNLRTDSESYKSGLYYYDTSKSGVVVYSRNLHGVYQTIPLTNPTLESILSNFGRKYGSLHKIHALGAEDKPSDSEDILVPEYHLHNFVLPGHYLLVQSGMTFERGSWQPRTDRGAWTHNFNPQFAYNDFFKKLVIDASERRRQEDLEYRSNSQRRRTKCSFSRDEDTDLFLCHFFICLRNRELKFQQPDSQEAKKLEFQCETRALKKLKKCSQNSTCFFCGGTTLSVVPFCNSHTDTVLSKLYERLASTAVWKSVTTSSNNEVDAEKQQEQQDNEAAKQSYEKYMKKPDQYRYLDPNHLVVQKLFSRFKSAHNP